MLDPFRDRIMGLCNTAFSPMYRKVFKGYWHTSMISRVKKNQVNTNWSSGEYEAYLPTQENMDRNMNHYRIMVKVLPEVDRDIIKAHLKDLMRPRVQPCGAIDSELIVFVAQKRTDKGIRERQFLRAFNHSPPIHLNFRTPGYRTAIIISKVPEIIVKRLLMIVANFLKVRLQKLLKALKLEPWMIDYIKEERLYYMNKIEHFSPSITTMIKSMSHAFNWVFTKLREVTREIGRQNMVHSVIEPISRLRETLTAIKNQASPFKLGPEPPLITKLMEVLYVESKGLKAG